MKMQKGIALSIWGLISKFFFDERKKIEISVLLLLAFGLFSHSAFAQLALQDFNGGIPSTWAVNSNIPVTNNWVATSATGGYLGTPGVQVNPASNATVGTKAEYFLITPQFITPNVTEIRFHTKQGSLQNRGTIYELRLSTANQPSVGSFNVVLQSWTEAQLNVSATTYEEKIVTLPDLPANTSVYLAFVAITNQDGTTAKQGDTWFVDNVRVIESCAKVGGISATMSANGGEIVWTHATATDFEIQIVPKGGGIATSGTPVSSTSPVHYIASGLTDGTEYEVYIKTICDSTTASIWAGPFPVKTQVLGLACATPIVIPNTVTNTPYVLSTNLDKFHTTQGYVALDSKGFSCQPGTSTQNWLLGDHAYLTYTPTVSGLVNVSHAVTVGTTGCSNSLTSVFVFDGCPGIGTTPNCLGAITLGDVSGKNSGQLLNLYLEGGKTYYFIISSPFAQNPNNPNVGASICITFSLSAPTCPIPSGLAFENLLDTSATFSWENPQNFVSAWQYLVKPASAQAPTSSESGTPTLTNSNILVNTGLAPNTSYKFYVRSVCSGTPGQWSEALSFKTQCTTFPVPYSTQFTDSTNEDPKCWYSLDLNKDGRIFTYAGAPDNPPAQGNLVRLPTMSSGSATNDMLVSPRIHLEGKQKQIRYKFKGYGGYTNLTGFVLGESSYTLKLSTTGIGPNNFTTELLPIATYQTGNNYVEKIVAVPEGFVGDVNIAWYLPPGYTNTSTNFYVDDVFVEDMPDCSPPAYPGVTPGTITENSAQFFWTNGFKNQKWEIKVQPLNSGVPTTAGEEVTTNPATINNLTPSTQYEMYIRAICTAPFISDWVGPVKFNTVCDTRPVPYFESLNNDDPDTKKFCWSIINKAGDATRWTIGATAATINPQDQFDKPFVSYDDYLVSARINVTGQKMLKFKYKVTPYLFTGGERGNFEVLMSSDANFTNPTVLIPSHDFTNQDFVEDFVIFTGTGPAYFAFHVPGTVVDPRKTGFVTVDDFSIENVPTCPNPSQLTASNLLLNSAVLSWKKGLNETKWEIVIQNPNTGVPTGSGVVVNTNPTFNATGLTINTSYEYFVRAICSDSDKSEWIGPFKFKTGCDVLPTPFIETFEANSPTESCWTIVNNNNDSTEWFLNATVDPIFGEQMATLNCFKNGDQEEWLITPTLAVKPNQRLRFFYKNGLDSGYLEDLKVQVSTEGTDISKFTTTLFDTGVSGPITNVNAKEMVLNLTGITSPTNVNIAFHVPFFPPDPSGLRGSYLMIDNVIVEDIPVCPSVYNVAVSNSSITDTSVSVDWETKGSETSWQVSVQPYGTAAPVGDTLPEYLKTATAHPYTITGLTPSTKYQIYVRPVCSGTSQNEWIGPVDVLTKCDFSNTCNYTISVSNGSTGQVYAPIDVIQNGVVQQTLTFPPVAPGQPTVLDYTVTLCSGIEFNLYWRGGGSGLQYADAQVVVKDQLGNTVFTSPKGIGKINTTIYTAVSSCKVVTCPQPSNLVVSNTGVLSWTPGGSETQWEVYVQPLSQGTIPQSGVIVDSPTYTPKASDFALAPTAGTNEFFVRAICTASDKSYWTGPKVFIRNDEPTTAIPLTVNTDGSCANQGVKASFIGATASATPTSCGGVNGGDIWYEFVATSPVATVELSNFNPGSYYASGFEGAFPSIIMSLYEVQTDGTLVEKACSENNSIVASYSTELTVGKTYKIRVKYNNVTDLNDKKFDICVSTPAEICDMNAFNYSFEKPVLQVFGGLANYLYSKLVPGWRTNPENGIYLFQTGVNSEGLTPFEGGQCVQLINEMYKDFDTSAEVLKVDYSFASSMRGQPSTIELWAGPPAGPSVKIAQNTASSLYVWTLVKGTYTVPAGQTTTRFTFKVTGTDVTHHLLDAANFKVNTNVTTPDLTIPCNQASVSASAEGVGQWIVGENNPAPTVIESPTSQTTNINGFNAVSGVYTYFWKTRYCEKPFKVTIQAVADMPAVISPVEYCVFDTPVALTATAPTGYTLLWYTTATGGEGSTTAPIPSAAVAGTTSYYVALVDEGGCIGPRAEIQVVVNECSVIQKGLSPGADGKNDNFDLVRTGIKVKKLSIFNRYGTEVYSHGAGYTNQWTGQAKDGQALPDGTYFYLITAEDNSKISGWVFINREL